MNRRLFLGGAVGTSALALMGHSPYRRWSQYRAGHTVIVTDRADAGSFPLGERLVAHLAARRPDLNAVATRAESPSTILSLLKSRQLDVALLRAADSYQGLHGWGPFATLLTPLRALAAIAPEYLHVVVPASSPVRSLADLKGRRAGVVESGGRARIKALQVAALMGLEGESAIGWQPVTPEEAVPALARGAIDGCFFESPSRHPARALPRQSPDLPLRLVPHGDVVGRLVEHQGPIYFRAALDPDPDRGTQGDVLGEVRLVVCREDYPGERARFIAGALEGWSELAPPDAPLPIPLHSAVFASSDPPT
jgi:TRAP transporter TAXI family solute receptor